jgi:8-oxo-dGTP pyrophosphatase MutT (NUDIX family)
MTTTPAEPKPAASVLLVRRATGGAAPFEVYMIRRHHGMKFLGGYYAFPGGKVDASDAAPEALARCRGLDTVTAATLLDTDGGPPALAYWVTAVRELLEESGVLLACDAADRPVDLACPDVAAAAAHCRDGLMAHAAPFAELLAGAGWYCNLRPLRYLSHFVTPRTSPIRFTARFFLCPLPAGQAPQLYTEETSEGFWIAPATGYARFQAQEMAMAEPAEYGLGYLAQFDSLDELWAHHEDQRDKFHGTIHRIDTFWEKFDWKQLRWNR